MRILVVEDEPTLLAQLVAAITAAGHTVEMARDGQEAAYLGEVEDFDAVVLDLGLPIVDGLSVLRGWRRQGRSMPVLILTARSSWHEKVTGMDAGADDYLAKPFHMEELLARLRAHLRQAASSPDTPVVAAPTPKGARILDFGSLQIDHMNRTVRLCGETIALSTGDFDLLWELASHAGEVLTREDLLYKLRGVHYDGLDRSVDVAISRLRKKLAGSGAGIRTLRGLGYALEAD